MHVVTVDRYEDADKAFEDGADVVLHEVNHPLINGYIGHYCHVMVGPDDLTQRIRAELGWASVNATAKYVTFTILPKPDEKVIADRVTRFLRALDPE